MHRMRDLRDSMPGFRRSGNLLHQPWGIPLAQNKRFYGCARRQLVCPSLSLMTATAAALIGGPSVRFSLA